MYLSNIKLWNFRKFGADTEFNLASSHLDLNLTQGLNVLIGENDSGKTAIIDAIKLVLKTHSYEWIRVEHDDFYRTSERLRIELILKDLKDEEAKNFTEWLGLEEVEIVEGREKKKIKKPYLRLIYDVSRKIEDSYIFPNDVRAGVDNIGYPLTAEAREFLKITYLKPLRDANTELTPRRNSRLSQILRGHEAFRERDEDHYLLELFKHFNSSVENYFDGKDSNNEFLAAENREGKALKDEIDRVIKAFHSTTKESNFGVVSNTLKAILETLELSIKDDINPGLGTLNRLFMAAELLHLHKQSWTGLRLGLIEELEAHLHPQAQMKIIDLLQKEDNIQLILTTHSPNLGSKVKLKNLILCDSQYVYPLGPEYTKLDFDDYIFLERFLDVTKSNLFFAKGILLVEGWAEEILLPALANKMKEQGIISKDLTEAGISVVNIGNTAFIHYSRIFLRKDGNGVLNIPVSIVTDVDVREYEKLEEKDKEGKTYYQYIKRNKTEYEKELKEEIEKRKKEFKDQKVIVFVAPHWTLEYSLLKSPHLLNKFCEIFKKIHPRIDNTKYEEELAKKLINKGLKKTEIAYHLAQALDSDPKITIDDKDFGIEYLIEAIKYVVRN